MEQLSFLEHQLTVVQGQQAALRLMVLHNYHVPKDERNRLHTYQWDSTDSPVSQSQKAGMSGPMQGIQQRLSKDSHTSESSAASMDITEQLSYMQQQLAGFQEQQAALRLMVSDGHMAPNNYHVIKDERVKVILEHMGLQMQNKLARRCIPELGNDAIFCRGVRLDLIKQLVADTPEGRKRPIF